MNWCGDARRAARFALLTVAALLVSSCGGSRGGSTTQPANGASPAGEAVATIPLGDVAGAASSTAAMSIPNPYSADPIAIQQGHELFIKMNCAGCHGYGAKGAMGPDLTDVYWRYGGVPVAIYHSIHDGRPKGMPAWDPALPPAEIWKLVAYIESLGGSTAARDYQAGLQGDRPGNNVAPELQQSTTVPAAPAGNP